MLKLFIFGILINTGFSSNIACKDGQEIKTQRLSSASLLIGNWSYAYHWDKHSSYTFDFVNDSEDHELECPHVEIQPVNPVLVEDIKRICKNYDIPFRWEDAALRVHSHVMGSQDNIVIIGKKEHWLFVNCENILRFAALQVSEDIILLIDPERVSYIELITKKPLRSSELKCVARNLGVSKDISGTSLCY